MNATNKSSATPQQKKNFYDPEQVLSIPILDVCRHFGIPYKHKGREVWCSIRTADKTPSTVLHTEPSARFKINTYCDFGAGNETGNNIDLACHMLGLNRHNKADRAEAIVHLGDAFGLVPKNREKVNAGELSDREWALLGLAGDVATKNFSFDPDRMSIEQIAAISKKYSMSMNELKKAHPRTFERLIKTIAIPHIQEARNEYYMYLWMGRRNLREALGEQAAISNRKEFDDMANELRAMERALNRATTDTHLTPLKSQDYGIDQVLESIDNGELRPNFGTKTYSQMTRLAEANHTAVKYRTLDLSKVLYEGADLFGAIPFSAFLSDGNAVVGYLEKDTQNLRPIFEQLSVKKEQKKRNPRPLNDKLKDAKTRQAQSEPHSAQPPASQER